jgi:hypothetical protein
LRLGGWVFFFNLGGRGGRPPLLNLLAPYR